MQMYRIPVQIRSQDGHTGGTGKIVVARPPMLRRLWKAGVLFLIGVGVGLVLLPIPLIHLAGIMFFLAMTGLAIRRFFSTRVLKGAHGTCPSCKQEGEYFVGFGGRRLAFPITTSCPRCNVSLELGPAAPTYAY